MRILIATNHLDAFGGSETFTHTLVKAAVVYGHTVELMTNAHGIVSQRIIDDFGVSLINSENFDLVLANHNTMVKKCSDLGMGPIIQTCHGIFPKLEQPSTYAHALVAISEEVLEHIKQIKPEGIPSVLIRNMIDTQRFNILKPVNRVIKHIYSLSQSDHFNKELGKLVLDYGLTLVTNNKFNNAVWHTEFYINNADLVVSLGRGAMEAMSCGRQVLAADHRPYQEQISDGIINAENVDYLVSHNFSGRKTRSSANLSELIQTALELYDPEESEKLREWALNHLNYESQYQKYMQLWVTM